MFLRKNGGSFKRSGFFKGFFFQASGNPVKKKSLQYEGSDTIQQSKATINFM